MIKKLLSLFIMKDEMIKIGCSKFAICVLLNNRRRRGDYIAIVYLRLRLLFISTYSMITGLSSSAFHSFRYPNHSLALWYPNCSLSEPNVML